MVSAASTRSTGRSALVPASAHTRQYASRAYARRCALPESENHTDEAAPRASASSPV
jgi:hypothetical protein